MALTKPNESILNITSTGLKIDNVQDNVDDVQDNLNVAEADLYTEVENKILGSHITGLGISNNSIDWNRDIDIAPGFCKDDTFNYLLELDTALTKQIDAAWEAGTNKGGLDVGSTPLADTWYYIWLIKKDSDGSIDALFSTSATNPSMPSGWGSKRRIRGALLTNGSANINQFRQLRDHFYYIGTLLDFSSTSLPTTKTLLTVSCPANTIGIFNTFLVHGSVIYYQIRHSAYPDEALGTSNCDLACNSNAARATNLLLIKVDSNSQIMHKSSVSGVTIGVISTLGFIDNGQ